MSALNFHVLFTQFQYLEDKDIFEKFYKKMLAARLVNDKSASDDAETSMLSKLKVDWLYTFSNSLTMQAASGAEYTSKLQRMFQDMETNKVSNAKFKDFLGDFGGVGCKLLTDYTRLTAVDDFNVRVLTTTCWPYTSGMTMRLPQILLRGVEVFTTYYTV